VFPGERMEVGEIRIADKSDFDRLRDLCLFHDEWTQVYRSNMTDVWTRANDVSDFNMVKVGALSVDNMRTFRMRNDAAE